MKRPRRPSARPPGNQLPLHKISQMLEALAVNSNASQVARQVGGMTHVTVWRYAKAAGIRLDAGKAVQQRHAKPPETRRKILAALKANPNARAAARTIGSVTHSMVRKMARAAGVELRRYNRLPAGKIASIIAALKTHPNAKGVARQVGGVSHVTVAKIARAEGIELARGRPRKRAGSFR